MRKYYTLLIITILTLLSSCGKTTVVEELNLIPEPVFMLPKEGEYDVKHSPKVNFVNIPQNNETVKYIIQSMRHLHFNPDVVGNPQRASIHFVVYDTLNTEIGDEGYLLEVTSEGITIFANTDAGLFYGFQTFVQMMPSDITNTHYRRITIPCCTILDHPAYAWRGSHLDVSRHFFSVSDVKKHLDLMALYKLNKFHWHLTDDHGWRIEIDSYPLLTDIGAWRADRSDTNWESNIAASPNEPTSYGGFYTKDEIREIVEYAAVRHIDVIPEIEFPGHCSEILAAYPHMACKDDDTVYHVQLGPYWPPRAILCGGNDSVMKFLKDVMDEIIPLFPYEYIHVGGDEAWKDNWKRCPRCQARIKELGLKNEEELQSWMIREMEMYLNSRGKKIIGWDEILDGGVSQSATVMSWQGLQGGIKGAQQGNYVIMCPSEYCYFNFYQANPKYQPSAFNAYIPLYKVYQFNPCPDELTAEQKKYILGGQCNMWSEFAFDYKACEYQLIPRICAMSECLWTAKEHKDWILFRHKLVSHKDRLRALDYAVGVESFKPELSTEMKDGKLMVTLEYEAEGTRIFYTLNGDNPSKTSTRYMHPFEAHAGDTLKTLAYYNGKKMEEIYSFVIE